MAKTVEEGIPKITWKDYGEEKTPEAREPFIPSGQGYMWITFDEPDDVRAVKK